MFGEVGVGEVKEHPFRFDHEGDDGRYPAKPVFIKIEEEEDDDYEVGNEAGQARDTLSSSAVVPRPMEGLHESGPPPFLRKTYEMVEDPRSDPVVSWSGTGMSFVVWDHHEFSRDLLPKYFKHNNFSSFIRQLNTYGFRKIDSDRWDFAHEFFQRGNRALLRNIRRRARPNPNPNHPRRAGSSLAISDGGSRTVDVEATAEILKRDQDRLRFEILKLRQQQDTSHNEISAIEERIRCAENRHQHMFLFLSKAAKNPGFVHQMIQRKRSSETMQLEVTGGRSKKNRRLQMPVQTQDEAAEFLIEAMKPNHIESDRDSSGFVVPGGDAASPPKDHATVPSESAGVGLSDMSEAYQVVSENLLGDCGTMDNEDIAEVLNESNLYLEFEGLIRKPVRDWDGYGNAFLEPDAVGFMC